MKLALFAGLVCSLCACARADSLAGSYAALGELIVTNFATAPFPHPAREGGHNYHDESFSAAEHYHDSRVALFIPKGFRAGARIDFVVHFHGWRNNVTNALVQYHLIDQFAASHRRAILIVPQGPLDAPDSFGGKLEDPGGFQRFMDEALNILKARRFPSNSRVGKIILSGHSGGYQVISSIIAKGGMTDHVSEIWLFDALYAGDEKFVLWFDHHPGRFVDLYTEHGGTKSETENLMGALKENGAPFYFGADDAITDSELKQNHLVFLFSALPHDDVVAGREMFRRLLETSGLRK